MGWMAQLKYFIYCLSTKYFLLCCLITALIFFKLFFAGLISQTFLLIGWISTTVFLVLLRIYFLARRVHFEEERLRILDVVIQSAVDQYIEQLHEATLRSIDYTLESIDISSSLPHIEAEEESFCSICMNDITKGQIITALGCPHKFHSECVDTWIETKPSCPVCKKRVSTDNSTADNSELYLYTQEYFSM
ncbi:unnamed protein product [Blepharisma stoltei]|uniref:RING-type E3 ubiquitin transferase n=1 Tax=Blepharisma stoltei TaxID=1481888 RepID=A0AAU9IC09_9CILI|nr:unnamed protein product [Blepharisma stoltei]